MKSRLMKIALQRWLVLKSNNIGKPVLKPLTSLLSNMLLLSSLTGKVSLAGNIFSYIFRDQTS